MELREEDEEILECEKEENKNNYEEKIMKETIDNKNIEIHVYNKKV